MRIFLFIMLIANVFSSGCSLLDGTNASGLKDYFVKTVEPAGVKYSIQKCEMSPAGTRSCYMIIDIDPAEFSKLATKLNLKKTYLFDSKTGELDSQLAMKVLNRASVIHEFKLQTPAFDLKNFETWNVEPLMPTAEFYLANPPVKPISGNSTTSFDFLIYDTATNIGFVFLSYPYG